MTPQVPHATVIEMDDCTMQNTMTNIYSQITASPDTINRALEEVKAHVKALLQSEIA
jgi:hypothetical protein